MNKFISNVYHTIEKYHMLNSGDNVVVGLSGGADSCVLLAALCEMKEKLGISLVAAHLNHGIRGEEALRDQQFSKEFSHTYGIPFVTMDVSVPEYSKENKISSEMAGRELRYEFFQNVCKEYNCDKIAVAHNLNDRAETIVLNLIRGSAASGMEGIKPTNDSIIRPLIETARKDIEAYAQQQNINYITDSTNLEDIYSRNIVRNNILKQMCDINENAIENIIRCSDIISCENDFINSSLNATDIIVCSACDVSVDKAEFLKLHKAIKRRCILDALYKTSDNLQNVSSKQIDAVINNLNTGNKFEFGNGAKAYVTNDAIVFSNKFPDIAEYLYKIEVPGVVRIKETNCVYKFEFVPKYEKVQNSLCISLDNIDTNNIVLRTKKDGDFFKPFGMTSHKKVKKFFIDLKIPSCERNLYPLLVSENNVLGIIPLRASEDCRVKHSSQKILKITKCGGTYDE